MAPTTNAANDASGASNAGPTRTTAMLEVINVLTSFTRNHERVKLLRVSISVIRFLSVLNFVYTLLGVTFLIMAMCEELTPNIDQVQREQFFKIGVTVSIFAPLASLCDLLALRGLQLWRRCHLLPWLSLYGFALLLLASHAITGVVHHGFRWSYLALVVCALFLYSSWRHVFRQYHDMAMERPTVRSLEGDLRTTVAAAAAAASAAAATSRSPADDLPPKYEDLLQAPPKYDEETMMAAEVPEAAANTTTTTVTTESEVDGATALPPASPRSPPNRHQ